MRRFLLLIALGLWPTLGVLAADSPSVLQANQTLQLAGYPPLPAGAEKMNCYAWRTQSAGIYARFNFPKVEDLDAWLASLPGGLEKASPIPTSLLSPPLAEASWFTPPNSEKSYVFYRGRIWHSSPEMFRVYVDPEKLEVFLYYTWNNKRTYP